jgi:hypothetical protein
MGIDPPEPSAEVARASMQNWHHPPDFVLWTGQ